MQFKYDRKSVQNTSIVIKNVKIYGYATTNSSQLHNVLINQKGELQILDSGCTPSAEFYIDIPNQLTLMPGMFDSHVHGQGGWDFADVGEHPDKIFSITKALGDSGLSYVMATLVSLDIPTLKKSLKAINQYIKQEELSSTPGLAKIIGVHLEGPFISKKCKGAHAENALLENINLSLFKEIISDAPEIKQWKITIAADLPGAEQFIYDVKTLEAEGVFVQVFIGHCNPDDMTDLDRAFKAGAAGITHLGNGCQENCARDVQNLDRSQVTSHLVQWVLSNPETCPAGVELIVDGIHLSSEFVTLIKSTIGDKVVLVTDALGPTGLKDGLYTLGSLSIIKEKQSFYLANSDGSYLLKEVRLPNGGNRKIKTLAGSAATLAQCAEYYTNWIQSTDGNNTNSMESLYKALIRNPRTSAFSLGNSWRFPDDKNFVVLNDYGQLVVSLCNGNLQVHSRHIVVNELDMAKLHAPQKGFFQNLTANHRLTAEGQAEHTSSGRQVC